MRELLLSTTILASFLGGVVALLAPCCVSVMLPAYFASTFQRRTRIVGMTLVFATGVGTVIIPIALGASLLSRLISGQHALVFSLGGVAMVAFGAAMLVGWKFSLPMIGMRGGSGGGVVSVYSLGLFSGLASSCCAPVLAGVVAVSGAASSFGAALAIGVAYVFGMVAPLSVLALVWDRRDWGTGRLTTRTVRIGIGRWHRAVPLGSVLSGAVLVAMGLLTIALAIRGPSMGSGWQLRLTAWLDHLSHALQNGLAWLPGWFSALLVFGALAGVAWFAVRQRKASRQAEAVQPVAEGSPSDPGDCCAPAATTPSTVPTNQEAPR
ncbi:cytochrome c biogenesis protein CcdA [Kribbella aluminosa]|uniref:Cytochrome c biogenesis protein CcdA n=1 Tax=Kribbella aluminosa TaxID=416017 RepID=A0ABS4UBG3_9ACTN|nr:cytochrome c biogenesis protein CcdA [Kribbella aluminosa]MBP2348979.1 cytochrome c biogenesis protein CcdA [Kribbella aluminosa]